MKNIISLSCIALLVFILQIMDLGCTPCGRNSGGKYQLYSAEINFLKADSFYYDSAYHAYLPYLSILSQSKSSSYDSLYFGADARYIDLAMHSSGFITKAFACSPVFSYRHDYDSLILGTVPSYDGIVPVGGSILDLLIKSDGKPTIGMDDIINRQEDYNPQFSGFHAFRFRNPPLHADSFRFILQLQKQGEWKSDTSDAIFIF